MFRLILLVTVLLLLSLPVLSQKKIYIDEKGDTIDKTSFLRKFRVEKLPLSTWSYIGADGKKYTKLKRDLYLTGKTDYSQIKQELNKLTTNKIKDSVTIILSFRFLDDLFNSYNSDNKLTRNELSARKRFTNPIRKAINKQNILYLCLFENGIVLKKKTNEENEYFFSDKNDFFRNKIFTNPTTCGSFAAIKPNGEILVRNGEYRADSFAQYLKPENWSLFFKKKENINSKNAIKN